MVESSDLQGAIQRTQATERVQALQNQQEELERKRFELTLARKRAEKARKTQETEKGRIVQDRWDGDSREQPREDEGAPSDRRDDEGTGGTNGIDVRV